MSGYSDSGLQRIRSSKRKRVQVDYTGSGVQSVETLDNKASSTTKRMRSSNAGKRSMAQPQPLSAVSVLTSFSKAAFGQSIRNPSVKYEGAELLDYYRRSVSTSFNILHLDAVIKKTVEFQCSQAERALLLNVLAEDITQRLLTIDLATSAGRLASQIAFHALLTEPCSKNPIAKCIGEPGKVLLRALCQASIKLKGRLTVVKHLLFSQQVCAVVAAQNFILGTIRDGDLSAADILAVSLLLDGLSQFNDRDSRLSVFIQHCTDHSKFNKKVFLRRKEKGLWDCKNGGPGFEKPITPKPPKCFPFKEEVTETAPDSACSMSGELQPDGPDSNFSLPFLDMGVSGPSQAKDSKAKLADFEKWIASEQQKPVPVVDLTQEDNFLYE